MSAKYFPTFHNFSQLQAEAHAAFNAVGVSPQFWRVEVDDHKLRLECDHPVCGLHALVLSASDGITAISFSGYLRGCGCKLN